MPGHQIAHKDLAAAQQRGPGDAVREAMGKDAEAQQLVLARWTTKDRQTGQVMPQFGQVKVEVG